MQRVRVGLTGLACVFLLVLLAAAFFGLANHEQTTGPLVLAPADGPASNATAETPHEPLAELGVAPGLAAEAAPANAAVAVAPRPGPAVGR